MLQFCYRQKLSLFKTVFLLESYQFQQFSSQTYGSFFNKMGCRSSKTLEIQKCRASASSLPEKDDNFIEGIVCKDTDIKENEMKSFDLTDAGKILLIRQNGKLSAIGAKCTHYGAPLVNGVLGDGRVRCPWHGACFNIQNGDIEDFPGLDSLPCYQINIENNGDVKVRAKRDELQTNKRQKLMIEYDGKNLEKFVIIGGGPSAATCVETLRQNGFNGKITMICKENYLPYDRVKISKNMDIDIKKIEFRPFDFYRQNQIEILSNTEAVNIDTKQQLVELNNGNKLNYTKLYIATGLRAIKANIPGADLGNVIVLRNYDDAYNTNRQLNENLEVVILGSSFIGMEAANFCRNKVKKVTIIGRDDVPFQRTFGEQIGRACMQLFKDNDIDFIMNNGIKQCFDDDNDGKVDRVELLDGRQLKADMVIMGVGGRYNTDFLKTSDLHIRDDGSIDVNEYLQTNLINIYVGGDIAYAPIWSANDQKSTIGHYGLAHYHGRIAALNMIKPESVPLRVVPYFWTMLFGKSIRYAGYGKFTNIIHHGSVDELKFVAYYLNDKDEVIACSSCGMDPIVSQFAELLAQDKHLMKHDLDEDIVGWTKKLHEKHSVKL